MEEEDLTNKSQMLLEGNPVHKKVPVLFHGGRAIAESLVILEYIEETWPQKPLMPVDPYQRALARFWIKFGEDMGPVFYSSFTTTGEQQDKAIKEARKMLNELEEKCLGNNMFFGGNAVSLVDLTFGWLAYWLQAGEEAAGGGTKLLDRDSLPRLSAWAHAFKEVPVIKRNLPDYAKFLAHLTRFREKVISS